MANKTKQCVACSRTFTPTNPIFVLCNACGGRNRTDSLQFQQRAKRTAELDAERRKLLARTNWETQ